MFGQTKCLNWRIMNVIKIYLRDINGNKHVMCFNWDVYGIDGFEKIPEEDEILFVFLNGSCVYSCLNREYAITKEELIGCFA